MPRLAYQNPDISFNVTRLAAPSTKSKDPKLQSRSAEVAERIKAKSLEGEDAIPSPDVLSELTIDFRKRIWRWDISRIKVLIRVVHSLLDNAPSRTISLNDLKSAQILNEILAATGSSAEPHKEAPVS